MESMLNWFRAECLSECTSDKCSHNEIVVHDPENHSVVPLGGNPALKSFGVTVELGDGRYRYAESDLLGAGNFGRVYEGRATSPSKAVAIKHVSKANPFLAATSLDKAAEERARYVRTLRQEVEILRTFNHDNVLKLLDSFEDFRNFYMVLELLLGGQLKDFIMNSSLCPKLMESDVAHIMEHVLTGVRYIHGQHYCHRDLKCENVMLLNKSPISQNCAKLIDFGLTTECRPGQRLSTLCGTPLYMAPQVIDGSYDILADLWSCGVMMYILLCGRAPFVASDSEGVMALARRGNYALSSDDWYYISDNAKHMIRGLMAFDPKDRWKADEALNHAWIRQHAPGSSWRDLKHARYRTQ